MVQKKAKMNWRSYTVADVCPSCAYWNDCRLHQDCKALEILVKIREDMDCGNTLP